MSHSFTIPVIFLAFANRSDNPLPHLAAEFHRLAGVLKQAQEKGHCELVVAPYATVDDIIETFQDRRYRGRIAIFHYAGHAGSYGLLLESADNALAIADAGGLAAFLGQQSSLQLVFLNGCSTQLQAQALLQAGVSVAIATDQDIRDEVATEFASRFYQFLVAGDAIGVAFAKAQAAVQIECSSIPRHLYAPDSQPARQAERWPWGCSVRPGAEVALHWNLPDAADDPFFGLPPIPTKYFQNLPANPFVGLTSFVAADAAIFFGRGYQIRELYQQITAPNTPLLLLFYGQSGVGKSSLLAAGLTPRLEESYAICYLRRDQQQGLLGTLQRALPTMQAGKTVADAWSAIEQQANRPLLIVLDQVEEIFTRPNPNQPNELKDFLEEIQSAAADPARWPRGKLILSFRKEWLAEIRRQVEEQKLPHTTLFLQRLDRRGVAEAITGPTRAPHLLTHYHLTVTEELIRLMADDLMADTGSAVAPTLQIVLTKLWERAKQKSYDQPVFDEALYADLRAQGLGLHDILDQQIGELSKRRSAVVASGLALDVLAYHTTQLGTAEEHTRAELCQTYAHQQAELEPLIQECESLYLLVDPAKNEPAKPPSSRLAHDTLGPFVRRRFEESDASGQRARRILENRAIEWLGDGAGAVLDDSDLAAVERGATGMRMWTAPEQRLVAASQTSRSRRQQIIRTLWAAGIVAIVLIIAVAGYALWQRAIAVENEQLATSRELASAALVNLEIDPERSALLALYALDTTYTTEAENALRQALHQLRVNQSFAVSPTLFTAVAVSPDGRWLAAAGQGDPAVKLWDLTAPNPTQSLRLLSGHTGIVRDVEFSMDSQRLATANDDTSVIVWDVASGSKLQVLTGHQGMVLDVAFNPGGDRLVSAGGDDVAIVWNLANGKLVWTLSGHQGMVTGVAYSPDGAQLATIGVDEAVRLWSSETGKEIQQIPRQVVPYSISRVAFSPDGALLAFIDNRDAFLWRLDRTKPELAATLIGHANSIIDLAFDPSGRCIVTASQDKTARVWEAATGRTLVTLHGHAGWVYSAKFVPDGSQAVASALQPCTAQVATASIDGTVRLWNIGPTRELRTLAGHTAAVEDVVFSPDGSRLATGSSDNTAKVWDPRTGALLLNLTGHSARVSRVVFNPDGKTLATASFDGTARIWDLQTGKTLPQSFRHDKPIRGLALNHAGTRLATGSEDGVIRIWDTRSGGKLYDFSGHKGMVLALTFAPGDELLVSGGADGKAELWNANTGAHQSEFIHSPRVYDVAFSPDGQLLATGGGDSQTKIWSITDGRLMRTFARHEGSVFGVRFSRDGRWLATASTDGTAIVWDVASGEAVRVLPGSAGVVNSVDFSPDGQYLAAASNDSTVHMYVMEIEALKKLAIDRMTRKVLTLEECSEYLRSESCSEQ